MKKKPLIILFVSIWSIFIIGFFTTEQATAKCFDCGMMQYTKSIFGINYKTNSKIQSKLDQNYYFSDGPYKNKPAQCSHHYHSIGFMN